ncbi:MAG: branched-chain-amino-acid transaminase [Armatimonadota bacterium]
MSLKVYIDGKHVSKEDAKVSVWDHGLLYGDGIFEGIRAYSGNIFKLQEHIDRLYNSAKSLCMEIPLSQKEMTDAVVETCRLNNITDGYVRLVVTRGVGDLGLDPKKCSKSTIIIIADKIQLYPEEKYKKGLKVTISSVRKNFPESMNPKVKSLNYLNNILAKIEAGHAGADEIVQININGYVCECSADNIFIVKNGVLHTPHPSVGLLEGVTRDTVIEIAKKEQLEVREDFLTSHDLYVAEEMFLTGTGAEIISVVWLNGRTIGDGKPGPVTKLLLERYREIVKTDGVKINDTDKAQV